MNLDSTKRQVLVEKNFQYYYKVNAERICVEKCRVNPEGNYNVGIGSLACQCCEFNIKKDTVKTGYIICSKIYKVVEKWVISKTYMFKAFCLKSIKDIFLKLRTMLV